MSDTETIEVSGGRHGADGSPMLEQTHGPYQDVLNDPEFEGLTLYERKALLVNRELDSHGMGKYQWCIFFLCGFGYFLDLMWAEAFGLIATPMENELGFPTNQYGNIFSAFSAGLTAGAFIWGVLVDIIGRRYAFNLTCLISSIFGLCLGIPSSYNGILALTAFVGFGVGGNIPIDTTICLEFIPQNRRFLLALLSVFQPLGVIVTCGICYGFIPNYSCGTLPDGTSLPSCNNVPTRKECCTKASNMGWRYTLYCLGAITLAAFFLRFFVFHFQESPKFLLYQGEDQRAVQVLHNIAKFNGRESSISIDVFDAVSEDYLSSRRDEDETPALGIGAKKAKGSFSTRLKVELNRTKLLFENAAMARLTILVWIIYIFDYWGFNVAGSFLPRILLEKGHEINVSVEETYRNYIIIYTPGTVGVFLGALMYAIPVIGRKWGMVISSALMATSLFLFAAVNSQASNVGLNMMEYFFQSMFNAILYGWTPEVFPAPVRGTASGLASFWGRMFGIISPILAACILAANPSGNGVLYMAGGAVFICTIAILLVPTSRMGAQSY